MPTEARCHKCDRAECDAATARQLFLREGHYGHQLRLQAAEGACDRHAVDWRQRALDAEDRLKDHERDFSEI